MTCGIPRYGRGVMSIDRLCPADPAFANSKHTTIHPENKKTQLWDLLMVLVLICPSALVAALCPAKARWLEEGFTPEMNTGAFFFFLISHFPPSICKYMYVHVCIDGGTLTIEFSSPTQIHHQTNTNTCTHTQGSPPGRSSRGCAHSSPPPSDSNDSDTNARPKTPQQSPSISTATSTRCPWTRAPPTPRPACWNCGRGARGSRCGARCFGWVSGCFVCVGGVVRMMARACVSFTRTHA